MVYNSVSLSKRFLSGLVSLSTGYCQSSLCILLCCSKMNDLVWDPFMHEFLFTCDIISRWATCPSSHWKTVVFGWFYCRATLDSHDAMVLSQHQCVALENDWEADYMLAVVYGAFYVGQWPVNSGLVDLGTLIGVKLFLRGSKPVSDIRSSAVILCALSGYQHQLVLFCFCSVVLMGQCAYGKPASHRYVSVAYLEFRSHSD